MSLSLPSFFLVILHAQANEATCMNIALSALSSPGHMRRPKPKAEKRFKFGNSVSGARKVGYFDSIQRSGRNTSRSGVEVFVSVYGPLICMDQSFVHGTSICMPFLLTTLEARIKSHYPRCLDDGHVQKQMWGLP